MDYAHFIERASCESIGYDEGMENAKHAKALLAELGSPTRALGAARFFKTGKGEYGHGDIFIGVTVPDTRKVARRMSTLSLSEIAKLQRSKVHEERLLALLILVGQFERGALTTRQAIFDFYIAHMRWINNWDLVDTSAATIVGGYLLANPEQKDILRTLAHSSDLWERRIAIIATFAFIKDGSSSEFFNVAEIVLYDEQDLIHKATGWMLREVGKRISRTEERKFLDTHAAHMPRTALRYALEHFSEKKRSYYMKKHTP